MRQVICWFVNIGNWFVYIGKNPRFTEFLDSNVYTRLAIVTENELGLAFCPSNLPQKFRPDPSTFYLVIVVTNKQTNRQTNAGDSIIPRESFRGDNDNHNNSFLLYTPDCRPDFLNSPVYGIFTRIILFLFCHVKSCL